MESMVVFTHPCRPYVFISQEHMYIYWFLDMTSHGTVTCMDKIEVQDLNYINFEICSLGSSICMCVPQTSCCPLWYFIAMVI